MTGTSSHSHPSSIRRARRAAKEIQFRILIHWTEALPPDAFFSSKHRAQGLLRVGANIAWNAAMMRPDRFTSVCGMSVPFRQPGGTSFLDKLRAAGKSQFYWFDMMRAESGEAVSTHCPGTGSRDT
jgi:hypothetical protein